MKRLAMLLAFLPPAATASLACGCPDVGSGVELASTTLSKKPILTVTAGSATLECVERTDADQCSTYWVVPREAENVTVTAAFPDGTTESDTIAYLHDGHYPCRGDLRPVRDHVTHF